MRSTKVNGSVSVIELVRRCGTCQTPALHAHVVLLHSAWRVSPPSVFNSDTLKHAEVVLSFRCSGFNSYFKAELKRDPAVPNYR